MGLISQEFSSGGRVATGMATGVEITILYILGTTPISFAHTALLCFCFLAACACMYICGPCGVLIAPNFDPRVTNKSSRAPSVQSVSSALRRTHSGRSACLCFVVVPDFRPRSRFVVYICLLLQLL